MRERAAMHVASGSTETEVRYGSSVTKSRGWPNNGPALWLVL